MIRKSLAAVFVMGLGVISAAAIVQAQGRVVVEQPGLSGDCLGEQVADLRAQGYVVTGRDLFRNADGTLTVSVSLCPRCTLSRPPCQAPCRLAVATVSPSGKVTCP